MRQVERESAVRAQAFGPHQDAAHRHRDLIGQVVHQDLGAVPDAGIVESAGARWLRSSERGCMNVAQRNDGRELRLLPDEVSASLEHPWRDPVVVAQKDDVVAFRIRKAGVPVREHADIRVLIDDAQSGVAESAQDASGIVRRGVVRHDDFKMPIGLRERRSDAPLQERRPVERRNGDRDERIGRVGPG